MTRLSSSLFFAAIFLLIACFGVAVTALLLSIYNPALIAPWVGEAMIALYGCGIGLLVAAEVTERER